MQLIKLEIKDKEKNPKRRYADYIEVNPAIRKLFSAFWSELRAYYNDEGFKLTDKELMIRIEILFGYKFAKSINLQLSFSQGAASYIATILLRQEYMLRDEFKEMKIKDEH